MSFRIPTGRDAERRLNIVAGLNITMSMTCLELYLALELIYKLITRSRSRLVYPGFRRGITNPGWKSEPGHIQSIYLVTVKSF